MEKYYPPVGFHFSVKFDNLGEGDNDTRFQEVAGITAELGIEEINEGGENRFPHRLPTRAKYSNLVLKRGLLTDSTLIDWFKNAVENFQFKPVNVLVALLNDKHEPLASWSFIKAWPVKWVISEFKSMDNAIVVDTIELAYNYYTRLSSNAN